MVVFEEDPHLLSSEGYANNQTQYLNVRVGELQRAQIHSPSVSYTEVEDPEAWNEDFRVHVLVPCQQPPPYPVLLIPGPIGMGLAPRGSHPPFSKDYAKSLLK